jgi:dCTP deaminase
LTLVLKSERIAEYLEAGRKTDTADPLVIVPTPDPQTIRETGAASIDLRLGTWFVTLRQARMPYMQIEDDHSRVSQLTKTHYVPFDKEFYLHPGSFVLGATLEWLRIPADIAAYVIGRSGWGRRGLIIATATGVHPGFKGCLTLELTNVGEIPIAIRPGIPVCQLFLHSVDSSSSANVDKSSFVGFRRPTLGRMELDNFAQRLAGLI